MRAIVAGVILLSIMGGFYLSHSWMHPDFLKPMKAALIVTAIISALLILAGVANLALG